MRPPDLVFSDPRLAVLYDDLDPDRSDLDAYVAIVDEVSARTVIDVGCGTGCLAARLVRLGIEVVGVDPAAASLDVARAKPLADRVTWVHGDATDLVPRGLAADLAVMTGNVAQVFISDSDWDSTLHAIRESLRPGGWLVLETRRPEVRDWEQWDVEPTPVDIPKVGRVVVSRSVLGVDLPFMTFEARVVVGAETLTSTSTLRFRTREEVEGDLDRHDLDVVDVRDAPDRPGKEWVFLARRR